MPDRCKAVAFDLDATSLACCREALPGWGIEVVNGATAASLIPRWNPGAADLLLVQVQEDVEETLGLCRFLVLCSAYSASARQSVGRASGPHGSPRHQPRRADAPLLFLAPPGQENLVAAVLRAGARCCLVLPIHAEDLASALAQVCGAGPVGRHAPDLDQTPGEARLRD
jgi:hypothetical protein